MISSEVQRTLVKSPPELWAELSNPDSLARHLGELGEVAITRSEPEKLVEWEATGMTGTVAIKPSGWGTRVTLTVERELPEASAPEADLSAESPDAAKTEAETDGPDETEQSAGPKSPPSPTGEIRPEEPRPAPATEAARRAAGWPGPNGAGPAIESALRAAEDGTREVAPVPGAWPSDLSKAEETEPAAVVPIPKTRAEPEPRRGFFARLFGGRRRRTEEPTPTEAPPAPAARSDEELPPASSETAPEPRPDYLPASPEEALPVIVVAEHEPPVAEPEQVEAIETAAPPTEDPPAAEPEAEVAEDVVEETEVDAETTDADADASEADTDADANANDAEAREDPTSPRPSAKDIAAELQAAEESAAAEVTAILTGVLDRLGAAHHRPFSRA